MAGESLKQITKDNPPTQDIISYLLAVPTSMEAQILVGLFLGCALGMLVHYTRLWLTSDISGSWIDYMFRQQPKKTLLAVFSVASWSVGEVATGLFTTPDPVTGVPMFIGWSIVLVMGFKTGYMGDSILNKGLSRSSMSGATIAPTPGAKL